MNAKAKNLVKLSIVMTLIITLAGCGDSKKNAKTGDVATNATISNDVKNNNTLSNNNESLKLEGTWYNKTDSFSGILKITSFTDKSLKFQLQAFNKQGKTGDVSGTASVEKNIATFTGENGAKMTMKLSNNEIQIETNEGMNYYSGMGLSFDGTYSKDNNAGNNKNDKVSSNVNKTKESNTKNSNNESLKLEGTWCNKTDNFSGILQITSFTDKSLKFQLQVFNKQGKTGDVSGTASVEKNIATFTGENGAKMTMKLSNNEIQIETNEGMNYYSGMGLSFDDTYTKK